MRSKYHLFMYTFLGLALVIAVLSAIESDARANRMTQALEDGYARQMLEAQEHLQAITLKLGKSRIAMDADTLTELLSGVSRQADGAVAGLSSLPLSHAAMSETIKFCNQLADYTRELMLRAAAGDTFAAEELDRLGELEDRCTLLIGQLATARETMLTESLRMANEENAYYSEAQFDVRPLEQVADLTRGMEYPSLIYDGAFSDARHAGEPKGLSARRVSSSEAVDIAREFISDERVESAEAGGETGGVLAGYGVTLRLKDGTVLNAEVTKQGGELLWIVPEHAQFTPAMDIEQCEERARTFLSARGYGDMEANHYQTYDGLAVINFIAVQNGVPLYPDLIKLQLRMDTGEVVGLEANNYLMNHRVRETLQPELTSAQALAKVSPRLGATSARLCVIPYKDAEKLCYEIAGEYEGDRYLVYIDAITGEERDVLRIVNTSDGVLSA